MYESTIISRSNFSPPLRVIRRQAVDATLTRKMYTWANTTEMRQAMGVTTESPSPEVIKRLRNSTLKTIEPHPFDEFGFISNPSYFGTVPIRMILHYQESGLGWANSHASIFSVAHL
jgi:hypothetical protein